MNYEEASKKLEEIIVKLERGNLPMEEALALFEEGQKMAKVCHEKLTEAKGKLSVVKEGLDKLTEEDE